MILRIFSVYDSKACAFLQPFYTVNRDVALRHFARGVNDAAMEMGNFPADFTLYEIGSWDDQTGKITPLIPADNCGNGAAFKRES